MIRLTVVLFVTLVFPFCSWSQSIQVENYGLEDGLPSVETYYVFQDKKGFIWFATDNGVARFDGKEMTAYHVKQGLPDPVVFAFQEDSKGRIWFRSHSGKLAYFDGGKIFPYIHNKLLTTLIESDVVHSIYVDEQDGMWIGTQTGSIYIDKTGKVSRQNAPKRSLYVKTIDSHYIYSVRGPIQTVNIFEINNERI